MIESPSDSIGRDVCGHKWARGHFFFFGQRFCFALARESYQTEGLSLHGLSSQPEAGSRFTFQLYAAPSRCRQAALLFLSVYCSASYRGSRSSLFLAHEEMLIGDLPYPCETNGSWESPFQRFCCVFSFFWC